ARDTAGQRVSGVLEADSEAAVMRLLEEKSLFPVAVTGAGSVAEKQTKGFLVSRVRSRDIGIMYGQLADLIGSGVPLLRALDSLIRSTPNKKLAEILRDIRSQVADGKSLTESMRTFPETFPALHTAMVQAGERAAFLEDVLRGLAGFVERIDELRSKVMGALIYPALLTVLGVSIMLGALLFFVPKFEPLLANAKKPLPTQVIFAMSKVVRSYWYVLAVGAAVGVGSLVSSLKSRNSRRSLEKLRLKIPVVGSALQMLAITRFCRILGTMLANGVPMLQALKIAKDATGSTLMADQIAAATESVRDGKSLSAPLATGGMFPDQVLAMIAVAEESNKLDKVLLQIADTVERRTNR
ncbi:MAG TPA: type II secretion system F family protein, partial [Burkholderiales bacterium]|nr:type II secretion system F family protein [Burkholderiales bacterium]